MTPLVSGRALARRAATTITAAGVALLLGTAPAFAVVTASTDGIDTVTVVSNAAGDPITVSCDNSSLASVNGVAPLPPLACDAVGFVVVDANGGSDSVNLGGLTTLAFPGLVETLVDLDDSSVDSFTGSDVRDVVTADINDDVVSTLSGDDRVEGAGSASGGDGDDTFVDVSGSVQGGPGDDLIVGAPANLIDGGTGVDTVVMDYSASGSEVAVGLTLTDTDINGTTPTSSIEAYDVTASDGGNADAVDSHGYSGRVSFSGRAGNDAFVGGPGADVADLGAGDDVADPGPGSDFVAGGDGNDTFSVRDGFGDVVECGPGTDSVTADRADVLSGCESVALPAPETDQLFGPPKVTRGTKAVFTFGSPVAGATFECQVDNGAYKPCASPYPVRTKRLRVGMHTFQVRASQPAGNVDPTPASVPFKVKKVKKRSAHHA